MYGVSLWTDMNAATPLGARGRSVISSGEWTLSLKYDKHVAHMRVFQKAALVGFTHNPDVRNFRDIPALVQQIQILAAFPVLLKWLAKQNLDLRCVLISDPGTLGAGAKTRPESRICIKEVYGTLH